MENEKLSKALEVVGGLKTLLLIVAHAIIILASVNIIIGFGFMINTMLQGMPQGLSVPNPYINLALIGLTWMFFFALLCLYFVRSLVVITKRRR